MKSFNLLLIPSVVASLAALTGCDKTPGKVFVDLATNVRVDDERCGPTHGGNGGYSWYYLRSGGGAPPVGASGRGLGSFTPAPGVSYSTITRGGFGASGHGFGSGE